MAWLAACSGGGPPHDGTGTTADETALTSYQTCAALEADLKDMLTEEVAATFDQLRYWQLHPSPLDDASGPPPTAGAAGPTRQEGVDYSGTNNQETGVDEADFVKTDGYRIYVLNGNRLHVFGVPTFGQLVPQSTTEIEGWPTQMLVDKDSGRAAIFSQIYPSSLPVDHPLYDSVGVAGPTGLRAWRVSSIAKVTILDVDDPAAPKLVRELFVEGNYSTARLVDGAMRMAGYTWLDIPALDAWYWNGGYGPLGQPALTIDQREAGARSAVQKLTLDDIVPRIYERLPDKSYHAYSLAQNGCTSFHRPTDSHGRGVTSLLTVDLRANDLRYDADQILSNYSTIYASTNALYVVDSAQDWWWFWWNPRDEDRTNVHEFDISTPGQTKYVGSGRVRGQIHDSFSLSEKDGNLRVVTTTGWERWWLPLDQRPQTESRLSVLAPSGGRLVTIGKLGGIALGETLFASRFVGDRAYVVTAKFIDPLFTFDLSDPTKPRALGELKVPGVSTYIQSIGDGRLLTIGWGSSDNTIDESRTQVSLFDVTNDTKPALLDTQALASTSGWSYSEAQWEHKAFQYWGPQRLLAIPVSSYQTINDSRGWSYSYLSHLRLIRVDPTGLSVFGDIDHSHFYNDDPSVQWIYTDIRRSIFMGDFIYAISDRGISVHRIADLGEVAAAPLPGYLPNQYFWID